MFYVVVRGYKPGLYLNWTACARQVINFEGSYYKKFKIKRDAIAYAESLGIKNEETIYCNLDSVTECSYLMNSENRDLLCKHKWNKYYDSQLLYTKIMIDGKKLCVFRPTFEDCSIQKSNETQLIALYAALRIALLRPYYTRIVCNSAVVYSSWTVVNSYKRYAKMDPKKIELMKRVKKLRNKFEQRGGKIVLA